MAHEDDLPIEDSNHGHIDDKVLSGLPIDDVEDRLSRFTSEVSFQHSDCC